MTKSNERVDVRGIHPVYINGLIAIELRDAPRDITVEEARKLVKKDESHDTTENNLLQG